MKKDIPDEKQTLIDQIFVFKPDMNLDNMVGWTIQHLEQYLDNCRKDHFDGIRRNA